MSGATTAVLIASAAVGAVGAISSASAAAKSDKSQAAAAGYNAQVGRNNATMANQEGTQKELTVREQNAQTMGEARASLGQANIGGASGGTSSIALEQDNINGELNALQTRYERDTRAQAYTAGAALQDFQAKVDNQNASAAKTAGYFGAANSVLSSANRYYNASPPGGF